MINICIFTNEQKENKKLKHVLHEVAANISDEFWNIVDFSDHNKLRLYLMDNPVIDMLIFDVLHEEDIIILKEFRKHYDLAHLMILADVKQSPMSYIKPGINAQALLIRPYSYSELYKVLKDFVIEYAELFNNISISDNEVFVVSTKEGKTIIPYDQIYYFEALRKKIYVCTGSDEYGFYGTLEDLCEAIPKEFFRCHRSYIVNLSKIERIALSKSLIFMTKGIEIPLSRKYKTAMKRRCMS